MLHTVLPTLYRDQPVYSTSPLKATAFDGDQRHQLKRFFFKDPSTFEETPFNCKAEGTPSIKDVQNRTAADPGRGTALHPGALLLKLSVFGFHRNSLNSIGTLWTPSELVGFYWISHSKFQFGTLMASVLQRSLCLMLGCSQTARAQTDHRREIIITHWAPPSAAEHRTGLGGSIRKFVYLVSIRRAIEHKRASN